jgi:hypothetical protein
MFRDKTKENIVLGSSGTATIAAIGQSSGAYRGSWQGILYEAFAYSGDLTDEMIDAIVDYAYAKYDREARLKACVLEGTSTMFGAKADNNIKGFDFLLDDDLSDFMLFNVASGASDITGTSTGIRTADMVIDAATEVIGALTTEFDKQVIVVQAGSNDIYVDGDSAATQIAELKNLCTTYKTSRPNAKIVVCTMLQRGDPGVGTTATYNAVRIAYNALILAEPLGTYWDAVADFASITELAVADVQTNTTYYHGVADNYIHMKQAGFDLCNPVLLAAIRTVAPEDVEDTDTNLTTSANVLAQTGLTAFSAADALFVADLIEDVSLAIARHCNRITQDNVPTFLSASRVEYYDGTFSDEIVLRAYPVTAITSVYTIDNSGNETVVDSDSYRYDPTTGVLKLLGGWDIEGEFIESAVLSNRPGYYIGPYPRWPRGMRNVKVTYTGGWTAIPNDLVRIATQMVYDLYVNRRANRMAASDSTGSRTTSLRSVDDLIRLKADDLAPFVRRGLS